MGQARKKYTQQYKDEAVELVVSSGRPMAELPGSGHSTRERGWVHPSATVLLHFTYKEQAE